MEQAEWVLLPRAVEEVASKMGGKGMKDLFQAAGATTYPGRGIVAGRTADGGKAFFAYFIMGRSANSRNRVFVRDGDGIRTQAFDPAAMKDPSLIIYAPVRWQGGKVVVTNGDQTDTICDFLAAGKSFGDALRTRAFEPDAPNFTPRISLIAEAAGKLAFSMAILKAADDSGRAACAASTNTRICPPAKAASSTPTAATAIRSRRLKANRKRSRLPAIWTR